jgi:hypothetical protein
MEKSDPTLGLVFRKRIMALGRFYLNGTTLEEVGSGSSLILPIVLTLFESHPSSVYITAGRNSSGKLRNVNCARPIEVVPKGKNLCVH